MYKTTMGYLKNKVSRLQKGGYLKIDIMGTTPKFVEHLKDLERQKVITLTPIEGFIYKISKI